MAYIRWLFRFWRGSAWAPERPGPPPLAISPALGAGASPTGGRRCGDPARFIPRPDGLFPDPTHRWGGGVSAPLGYRKVTGWFSKFKRHLRAPYMNSPNNMNNCTYRSLMTSQVRSNEKFLLFSQGWAARQINATERNQTFRLTCIVFLTLLNTMLNHSGSGVRSRSSCVMRSRRSNFIFSLDDATHVLWSIFYPEHENDT